MSMGSFVGRSVSDGVGGRLERVEIRVTEYVKYVSEVVREQTGKWIIHNKLLSKRVVY